MQQSRKFKKIADSPCKFDAHQVLPFFGLQLKQQWPQPWVLVSNLAPTQLRKTSWSADPGGHELARWPWESDAWRFLSAVGGWYSSVISGQWSIWSELVGQVVFRASGVWIFVGEHLVIPLLRLLRRAKSWPRLLRDARCQRFCPEFHSCQSLPWFHRWCFRSPSKKSKNSGRLNSIIWQSDLIKETHLSSFWLLLFLPSSALKVVRSLSWQEQLCYGHHERWLPVHNCMFALFWLN